MLGIKKSVIRYLGKSVIEAPFTVCIIYLYFLNKTKSFCRRKYMRTVKVFHDSDTIKFLSFRLCSLQIYAPGYSVHTSTLQQLHPLKMMNRVNKTAITFIDHGSVNDCRKKIHNIHNIKSENKSEKNK